MQKNAGLLQRMLIGPLTLNGVADDVLADFIPSLSFCQCAPTTCWAPTTAGMDDGCWIGVSECRLEM